MKKKKIKCFWHIEVTAVAYLCLHVNELFAPGKNKLNKTELKKMSLKC